MSATLSPVCECDTDLLVYFLSQTCKVSTVITEFSAKEAKEISAPLRSFPL